MSSDKKYFPIHTNTACKLKWSWSTVRLFDSSTSSCHRVDRDYIDVDSFDTFHNTEKKINDRTLMLNGQWPSGGCEYCQIIEESGGQSDRQFHLKIPNQYPIELDSDLQEVNVTPSILEVYLDNVCNMKCVYCSDLNSSQIRQENTKFGIFSKSGVTIKNREINRSNSTKLKEKFWDWMDKNIHLLSRLHILGGEPFYQKDFETCLTFLESKKNPNLEFNVISNLMIDQNDFQQKILRIKQLVSTRQIKRFDLTASIDCFGQEQEYARSGLNLDIWKNNFEFLVAEKWINLNINQTLSTLTIKTMPELVKYINQFNDTRDIGHYMSTVVMTHKFLHPKIFGDSFFSKDFDTTLNLMKENTWQQKEAKECMTGIYSSLKKSIRNQSLINQLVTYLTELDRRRNTNWKETFPWLEKEVSDVV